MFYMAIFSIEHLFLCVKSKFYLAFLRIILYIMDRKANWIRSLQGGANFPTGGKVRDRARSAPADPV